jgi:hypothetical protein
VQSWIPNRRRRLSKVGPEVDDLFGSVRVRFLTRRWRGRDVAGSRRPPDERLRRQAAQVGVGEGDRLAGEAAARGLDDLDPGVEKKDA